MRMKRRGEGRQKWLSLGAFFLVLAVVAGYVAAKYFFDPYLFQEGEEGQGTVAEAEGGAGNSGGLPEGSAILGNGQQKAENPVEGTDEDAMPEAEQLPQPPAPPAPGEDPAGPAAESITSVPPEAVTQGEGAAVSMYCVQFGSFLAEEGAKETLAQLQARGIDAYIVNKADTYKVLGTPYASKEEARQARDALLAVAGQDLFVTTMEVKIQ